VIEMTLVGMYAETSPAWVSMIGSAVSEPPPRLVGQLGGALEQAAVEVEHVARVRLAARRAAEEQRHLAVRDGLLGEIIVDDQRVAAVVAEVLGHGDAGVRRDELQRGRLGGAGDDHRRVLHRARLGEAVDDLATVDCFWPMAT
jgi:hypothetical protein